MAGPPPSMKLRDPFSYRRLVDELAQQKQDERLLDEFAGLALNGLLAAEAPDVVYDPQFTAQRAYDFARAMMKVRNEPR